MLKSCLFIQVLLLALIALTDAEYADKMVGPNSTIELQCLDLIRGTNKNLSLLESCQVFKCFEERFTCGNKYWIMNWGYKYCRRYSSQEFINKFTETGKRLLEHLNKCLPKFLEKYYKSTKPIGCEKLTSLAFKAQGKCYLENLELFCTGFPENKDLFIKVLDQNDFLNFESISMISRVADRCNPKLDLASFIFG